MGKLKQRTKLHDDIIKIYTNPMEPGSFTSSGKLLKQHFQKQNKNVVDKALQSLDAYTKHKPVIRKFQRNKVVVGGINEQWQIDLMDMQKLAKYNKGFKYVLTVIDVFSKYAWGIPIKTKSNENVTAAFKKILDKTPKPKCVQSDKGTEFIGRVFQNLLKAENIAFFTSENDEIKASIVERFNRTLKEKLWRYFTHNGTYKYIDVLQALVHSYNNTIHSTLKMTPTQITAKNQENIFYNIYKISDKQIKHVWQKDKDRSVQPGDRIRIIKTRSAFDKGYEPNWTTEVFTVTKHKGKRGCIIEDDAGEEIKGVFYPEEVQKVLKPQTDTYPIEKVLRYRGKGKRKEAYVRWKGYSDKFDQWIPARNITKITASSSS